MIQSILKVLQTYSVEKEATINGNKVQIRQIRKQGQPLNMQQSYAEVSLPTNVDQETFNKINEELVNLGIQADVQRSLGVGDDFPDFGQIKKVFEEGTSKLAHKKGQVLLVDIWATWCGPCQKPMAHNQQMIEKNQYLWKDKVRIVGVSVDDQINSVINRVNTKGWNKVQHLTLNKWDGDHELIKSFSVNGIPFICLVNCQGKIHFTGHPSGLDLEKTINDMLAGIIKADAQDDGVSQQVVKKLNQVLKQQNFKKQFSKASMLSVTTKMTSNYKKGKNSNKVQLEITVADNQKQFLDHLRNLTGNLKGVKVNQKILQYQEIPKGNVCCQCMKAFIQGEWYYWCKWSPNPYQFRCRTCCQKKDQINHFHYLQNSILTNGKGGKTTKLRLGHNYQPVDPKNGQKPSYCCNGCSSCPSDYIGRYLCIDCRPDPNHAGNGFIDICENCLDLFLKGDENMKETLAADKHTIDHSYLRILFNVKNYYEY